MTNTEVMQHNIFDPVIVTGGDYVYQGWLVAVFSKRRGGVRCVVEDEHGRLFIHSPVHLSAEKKKPG
jgi:hypothetical protein